MKRYVKIDDVDLDNESLPNIGQTPEGLAMGYVPGWAFMADPDYMTIPNTSSPAQMTTLDRVNGEMVPSQRSSPPIPEKATINGQTFIDRVGASSAFVYDPQIDINPDEWSVWAVIAPTAAESSSVNFIIAGKGDSGDFQEGEISPAVSYSQTTGNVHVYEWGGFSSSTSNVGDIRLQAESELVRDGQTPALVLVTFSSLGLRIRVNGNLEASAPNDTRPLDSKFKADEYRFWRSFNGKSGMSGILRRDLSKSENSGYRRAIESFLMNKYGIPEGPQ